MQRLDSTITTTDNKPVFIANISSQIFFNRVRSVGNVLRNITHVLDVFFVSLLLLTLQKKPDIKHILRISLRKGDMGIFTKLTSNKGQLG